MPEQWLSDALLAMLCGTGAVLDIRCRRLPNWLCALGLASGLGVALAHGGFAMAGSALVHAAVALVVGMGLFALGAIGGGDAKFYAALAAWFPLAHGFLLAMGIALSGLLLLAVWFPMSRRVMRANVNIPADSAFRKMPYGVAIALGAIVASLLVPST